MCIILSKLIKFVKLTVYHTMIIIIVIALQRVDIKYNIAIIYLQNQCANSYYYNILLLFVHSAKVVKNEGDYVLCMSTIKLTLDNERQN